MIPPSPLVIFHKQLGDLLLLEPGLAKLAAAGGNSVRLSTRAAFLPMVSLMEGVAGESGVKISRASQVISWSGNIHAAVKAAATLSPSKKLWVLTPRNLRSWHRIIYPAGAAYLPAWDQYRARYYFNVMPCPQTIDFRPPRLQMPPTGWKHPELPDDYILLHPTSAWPTKSWPAERWSVVLNELHATGFGPFVLSGGSAGWEKAYANEVCSRCTAPVLNLGGKTSLQQYLYSVANASLVLCIDGSSSHLAPAFNRPSLTLFGNTPHVVWHLSTELSSLLAPAPGSPLHDESIHEISTDAVIELALKKLLKPSA